MSDPKTPESAREGVHMPTDEQTSETTEDESQRCDDCGHELGGGRRCRSVGMCRCGFNHTRRES